MDNYNGPKTDSELYSNVEKKSFDHLINRKTLSAQNYFFTSGVEIYNT